MYDSNTFVMQLWYIVCICRREIIIMLLATAGLAVALCAILVHGSHTLLSPLLSSTTLQRYAYWYDAAATILDCKESYLSSVFEIAQS